MGRLNEIHGFFEKTTEKIFIKNFASRVGHAFHRLEQCQDTKITDHIPVRYRSGTCFDRFRTNYEIFNLIKCLFY
jgi:hypothetical protein